jgi:hypothetical protein
VGRTFLFCHKGGERGSLFALDRPHGQLSRVDRCGRERTLAFRCGGISLIGVSPLGIFTSLGCGGVS